MSLSFTVARDRLTGAILGAKGQELVTVRAGDLRTCLAVADAVDDARQLIGENERLQIDLIAAQRLCGQWQAAAKRLSTQLSIINDRNKALAAQAAALKNRIRCATELLKGAG